MTAVARTRLGWRPTTGAVEATPLNSAGAVAAILCVAAAVGGPAHAQLAGSAAVMSDYVYRGGSLTDGDPALSVSLAYDGPHGLYAGGSVIGDWDSRRGPQVLGLVEYIGYAVRPRRGPTWDFGVTNANYRQNPNEQAQRYAPYHIDATEFHVGMIFRNFSYYSYVSPNYFDPTVTAIYNELNTTIRPGRGWRIIGHVGVLNQLSGDSVRKPHYDISAGLVRPFRGGEARLTWTTTFVATDYPATYARGRGLALIDLTLFF